MKRSRTTALLLMGAAPLLFTACEPGPPVGQPAATVQEGLYTSVERCADATGDAATCQSASEQAKLQAADAAPQYASRAECERDYPAEQCAEQRTSAGHSFIGPLMTGFFLSQMMGNRAGNRAGAAPVAQASPAFRDNSNGWLRPGNTPGATGAAGRAGLTPVTATPDRATTVNRGGFGASGRNRDSVGG